MEDDALIGPVPPPELHVMTYNIRRRLAVSRPGSPDRWATRRPLLQRLLARERPAILGVQEALPDQSEAVLAALGDGYSSIGDGRDARGAGERSAIFWDTERLELVDWRQRALSLTPDVPGSRSWGNLVPRVLVSAEFTDRATGSRVVAVNTHLDHLSWRSRAASARMIRELAAAMQRSSPDAAVVVTGDMNAGPGSATLREFTADGTLRDAWEVADDRLTPAFGTYSGYRRPRPGGRRIDFILVGPTVEVARVGINAARLHGAAPSDHEPVHAVIRKPRHGAERSS